MGFPFKAAWSLRAIAFSAILATASVRSLAATSALFYLQPGRPEAATLLAPPPLPDSAEQASDLAEVVAVHSACTSNEATVAFSEKKFTIFTFTPAIGEFFQPGKFPKTEALFDRVQKDAEIAVGAAKDYWKRPRPYTVLPSLAVGKLETSFGYPSGHSTESMVMALVLADLFPDHCEDILGIARGIGWHRVMVARHYPTDIYAGRVFAQAIVRELKASPVFSRDLAESKAEVETATIGQTSQTERRAPALREH